MKVKAIYVILGLGLLALASVVLRQESSSTATPAETPPATAAAKPAEDKPAGDETVDAKILVFKVEGMTSGSSEEKITKALKAQSGVGRVEVNVARGLVAVESATGTYSESQKLAQAITEAGFPARYTGRLTDMPSAAGSQTNKDKSDCGLGCCS